MRDLRGHIDHLDQIISKIKANVPLETAVRDTISKYGERIFEKGLKSDHSPIGTYSTKKIYIKPQAAPKAVKNVGKTGRKIKSGYYPGGYKEFRNQQGRESSFVNLRLTNELQNDVLNLSISKGSNAVGIVRDAKAFKTGSTYKVEVKKNINAKKVEGLEGKYGTIFDLSKIEEDHFSKVYEFELEKLFD